MREFLLSKGPLGRIRRREDVDPPELDGLFSRLQVLLPRRHAGVDGGEAGVEGGEAGLRVLKRDRKTQVYAGLTLGGRPLCLKVYRDARRGRRGFRNLCGLLARGVPVPEPFFLWERSRAGGAGAIVGMEDLAPRPELDRWLSTLMDSEPDRARRRAALRPVFRTLGAGIRDLHAQGVYLDDLKTCNIFIEGAEPLEGPPSPRFRFVDLDGATQGRPVSLRLRARNLVQLNRSTPVLAGLGSRRAFWREYSRGLAKPQARRLRRAVLHLSAARPVVYVSASGVREEAWPAGAWDWPR